MQVKHFQNSPDLQILIQRSPLIAGSYLETDTQFFLDLPIPLYQAKKKRPDEDLLEEKEEENFFSDDDDPFSDNNNGNKNADPASIDLILLEDHIVFASMLINFIFDERQERTREAETSRDIIKGREEQYESLATRYASLVSDHSSRLASYETAARLFWNSAHRDARSADSDVRRRRQEEGRNCSLHRKTQSRAHRPQRSDMALRRDRAT